MTGEIFCSIDLKRFTLEKNEEMVTYDEQLERKFGRNIMKEPTLENE